LAQYQFTKFGPKIIWTPFWILVSSRPRQWLKNIAIFATLVFEGEFFNPDKFWLIVYGFIIFCLVTSGTYLINDVIDAKNDQAHPFKRRRPIASGNLSGAVALAAGIGLLLFSILLSMALSSFFMWAIIAYMVLQIAYSLALRSFMLLDVMTIATGFLLRVFAGAVLINAHVTVWFILTVASLALFLAIGKRRSERTLLTGSGVSDLTTRKILAHYPENLLDSLTVMFATATWFSYTMFTFLQPSPFGGPQVLILFSDLLPKTFLASKWLMATVPFVIYGVMRYLYVIYEKKEGESPERVLLGDIPLLSAVLIWGFLVFVIIYGGDILPVKILRFFR
jgi:4-hydroxybenzoate polyprenyltransferase